MAVLGVLVGLVSFFPRPTLPIFVKALKHTLKKKTPLVLLCFTLFFVWCFDSKNLKNPSSTQKKKFCSTNPKKSCFVDLQNPPEVFFPSLSHGFSNLRPRSSGPRWKTSRFSSLGPSAIRPPGAVAGCRWVVEQNRRKTTQKTTSLAIDMEYLKQIVSRMSR